MSKSVVELFNEACDLDERDRATLAGLLLESIEQEPDPEMEAAWRVEIERRLKEIESGTARLIPWAEVKAKHWRDASRDVCFGKERSLK